MIRVTLQDIQCKDHKNPRTEFMLNHASSWFLIFMSWFYDMTESSKQYFTHLLWSYVADEKDLVLKSPKTSIFWMNNALRMSVLAGIVFQFF